MKSLTHAKFWFDLNNKPFKNTYQFEQNNLIHFSKRFAFPLKKRYNNFPSIYIQKCVIVSVFVLLLNELSQHYDRFF